MPPVRRLAAILAADVAGYSRLMGMDEEGTHERLKAHLRKLIEPKITDQRGRIVKNTGDGFLAEFASVVDAVRCAVEVQRGTAEANAGTPPEKRIEFRVGINLGDVIVEEHDIFGDGVNVAARLEALAEPGGICISRVVREQIRDKLPYPFEDRGEETVKNIARPVRVFALRPETIAELPIVKSSIALPQRRRSIVPRAAAAAAAVLVIVIIVWWAWPPPQITSTLPAAVATAATTSITPPPVAPRLSIVVLPFANLSNDPDQQYFADAITEDLTTDLSRLADMFVISRNSAFTYKDKPVNAKQIGRELGVRYVLEGSVQRTSNAVRVNAQLINAETAAHLWAERFDREMGDLFALQNDITNRIALAFHIELIAAEAARPTEHPDALDYILRGRAARLKPNSRNVYTEVISLYERALALDPLSVEAQTRLAEVLADRVLDGMSNTRANDLARAEALVGEAIAASPHTAAVHFAKGEILRAQGQVQEAIPEFETVLVLDRSNAWALFALAHCKLRAGSIEEVIPLVEQAMRLSPRDPNLGLMYFRIGEVHLLQSHADEAITWFEKARSANPEYSFVRVFLASGYGLKGEIKLAAAELAAARRLSGNGSPSTIAREKATFTAGFAPAIRPLFDVTYFAGLRKAGVPEE
jgi:TolB-like protein/class 3 adenylate cyclase/Flp pilus assembly protein TadD